MLSLIITLKYLQGHMSKKFGDGSYKVVIKIYYISLTNSQWKYTEMVDEL